MEVRHLLLRLTRAFVLLAVATATQATVTLHLKYTATAGADLNVSVTVKGRPRLGSAAYTTGSGSTMLTFTGTTDGATKIDLHGGAIIATEASAALRNADGSLP